MPSWPRGSKSSTTRIAVIPSPSREASERRRICDAQRGLAYSTQLPRTEGPEM
jgi:hypothetical protein